MKEDDRPRWSRRRWIAEHFGCDLSEVEPYQDTRTPRGGLPLFQYDGRLVAVVLNDGEMKKLRVSVPEVDHRYEKRTHWRDASTSVFVQRSDRLSDEVPE